MIKSREKVSKKLQFLIIIIITLGILFRLINLSDKVYWTDEVFTSLRISGYTMVEVEQQLNNKSQLFTVDDLHKYQNINDQKNSIHTILGLAKEEPQLPPLYFLMARVAVKIFGNSIAVPRGVSAFLSLLVFPCIYWLIVELFDSVKVGWICMSIIAVSPFHVLYAQEARPYSLWTVTILLSSATFLRAIRLNTKSSWLLYLISITLGLYSYLLSLLVIVTHGLYLLIINHFKFTKVVVNFLGTCLFSLVAYLPWIILFMSNYNSFQETSEWGSINSSLSNLINEWIRNISYGFMDFWYYFTYNPASKLNLSYGKFFIPLLLALSGYSLYILIKKNSFKTWLFVLLLIIINVLPLAAPDLIFGGRRSMMARYFIPAYLGIQISVAYLFTFKLNSSSKKNYRHKLWQLSFGMLILGGIISCSISSQANAWWNKAVVSNDTSILVQHINKKSNPVIITYPGTSSFTMSYLVNPETKFIIADNNDFLNLVNSCEMSYFYGSSKKSTPIEKDSLKYKTQLVSEVRSKNLWQIKPSFCKNANDE